MAAAEYSLIHASELKIPTLLIHGSDDMICSPKGSAEFAGKSSKVEFKIWDGGYHELQNELSRNIKTMALPEAASVIAEETMKLIRRKE